MSPELPLADNESRGEGLVFWKIEADGAPRLDRLGIVGVVGVNYMGAVRGVPKDAKVSPIEGGAVLTLSSIKSAKRVVKRKGGDVRVSEAPFTAKATEAVRLRWRALNPIAKRTALPPLKGRGFAAVRRKREES